MPTTFYIYDMLTGRVRVMAWTPVQALQAWHWYKREPTQIICELPKAMNIDIDNSRNVPSAIFIEGGKRWQTRVTQL